MTLQDWLTAQDLSPAAFARKIGKPQATVQRYVSGKRIPQPEEMALIVKETGGAVTANDFYGIGAPEAVR